MKGSGTTSAWTIAPPAISNIELASQLRLIGRDIGEADEVLAEEGERTAEVTRPTRGYRCPG